MFSTQLLTLYYLLYSPTEAAAQFLQKLSPFIQIFYVCLFFNTSVTRRF